MNARLLAFSLNLGMSFAILLLYVSSEVALALVVLLITGSIVASDTKDLTRLRKEKISPIIIVGFTIFVVIGVSYLTTPNDVSLFYELILINFGFLVAYISLRLATRQNH
jgi:hypothetical protein